MDGKEKAGWLADKICNGGDYAKEAAIVLVRQAEEIDRLKRLAGAALAARNAEARAAMAYENARNNFSQDTHEQKQYERAMIAATEADKSLRNAL